MLETILNLVLWSALKRGLIPKNNDKYVCVLSLFLARKILITYISTPNGPNFLRKICTSGQISFKLKKTRTTAVTESRQNNLGPDNIYQQHIVEVK